VNVDLQQASPDQLKELIDLLLIRLQSLEERNRALEERNKELEAELERLRDQSGDQKPPSFVRANRKKPEKKPRKKRTRGFARKLDKVTRRLHHAYSACPDCNTPLSAGRVSTIRRVIELPALSVEVIEHIVLERDCPHCLKSFKPSVDFSSVVVGHQRFGISVQTEVAVLREQYRLPFRLIQDYLRRRWGLHVSIGEIVALVQRLAQRAKGDWEELGNKIRGSPVVNADETGWREDGVNGYLWSFSTSEVRYFLYRKTRSQVVVKEVLGEEFDGTLVTDFYAGYNAHKGLHQRCWTHLLRDIHELKQKHENDESVQQWAKAVKAIYEGAKAYRGPSASLLPAERVAERVKKQREFENELMEVCKPYLKKKKPQSTLCDRIEKHLPELFMFVADERVPADNNAAERSLREPVVSRKISGGTRSEKGSETKSILTSLFGTWRLLGLDLYESCRKILTTQ
jgi:transposase